MALRKAYRPGPAAPTRDFTRKAKDVVTRTHPSQELVEVASVVALGADGSKIRAWNNALTGTNTNGIADLVQILQEKPETQSTIGV